MKCGNNEMKAFVVGKDSENLEFTYFLSLGDNLMFSESIAINMKDNVNPTMDIEANIILESDGKSSYRDQVIAEVRFNAKLDIIPSMEKAKLLAFVKNPKTGETRYIFRELQTEACQNAKLEFRKSTLKPGELQTVILQAPPDSICGYRLYFVKMPSFLNF